VCRLIIRNEFSTLEDKMLEYLDLLSQSGADECWHKCGTFKEHLFHVWRILYIWNQSQAICRLGLFHSAYSNSYVNLALFNRNVDRSLLKEKIGEEAEQLVYLFCVVHRHHLIIDDIAKSGKIPPEGKVVKHIVTGEDLHISAYIIGIFLVATIADFSDQRYSWQDDLLGNINGSMAYTNYDAGVLWPGDVRPGIWVSWVNKLAKIVKQSNIPGVVMPPIFNYGEDTIVPEDEIKARDLYWAVITNHRISAEADNAARMLHEAIIHNPHMGEPHVLLSQIYIQKKKTSKKPRNMQKKALKNCRFGELHGTRGCLGRDGLPGLGLY